MKLSLFILFFFFVITIRSSAQVNINFDITLQDSGNKPDTIKRNVQVYYLYNNQYTKVYNFSFKGSTYKYSGKIPSGKYIMDITSKNYNYYRHIVTLNGSETNIEIKGITLLKSVTLKEVNISGLKNDLIKIEADRTTINVKNNDILSGGNAYEAISRLPGVLASPGGTLNVNGKSTVVWIDGVASNLSGQDLNNFLTSLPAKAIEKIELITSPGASFDANTNGGGIINIITEKKNKIEGISGSVNTSYSYNKYHKSNNSILLNGRHRLLEWQLPAGINYTESFKNTNIQSEYISVPNSQIITSDAKLENANKSIFIRPGIRFLLSEASTIRLNYNLNLYRTDPDTKIDVNSVNLIPMIDYSSNFKQKGTNTRNEIITSFTHKIDSNNKHFDITGYWLNYSRNISSFSELYTKPNQYTSYTNNFNINNIYLKNDWVLPFPTSGFTINAGAKMAHSSINSKGFYTNTELPFKYSENNLAAYTEAKKTFGNLNVLAGLRMEYFNVDSKILPDHVIMKRDYLNFFPNINLLYKITPVINLIANYTRKITQPGYTELDPNLNGYFDKYTEVAGNPNLQPSFYNNYEAKITAFNYISLSVNYSYSKNKNLLYFERDQNTLKTIQTYKTFNDAKTFSSYITFPIPFKLLTEGTSFLKKNINPDKENFLYVNGGYIKSYYDEITTINNPVWYFGLYSQLILPADFKLSLYYNYSTKGTYDIYQLQKPVQSFDAALSKSLFNKKIKIDLSVHDLFNTSELNADLYTQRLNTTYYQKLDSRNFRVSLSYSFGKYNSKKKVEIEKEDDRIETKTEIISKP